MKVLLYTLISAVASVALVVPAATAATRPDDRSGPRGPGAIWLDPSLASVVERQSGDLWVDPSIAGAIVKASENTVWLDPSIAAAVAKASESTLWLDPAIAETVRIASTSAVRPDDRSGRREAPLSGPAITPVASTSSFNWNHAGIGVGVVFGLSLIALTSIALIRRESHELTST